MPNTGVLIISWGNASDAQIQKIVSEIYSKYGANVGAIQGMNYREYGPESLDRIKKVYSFIEEQPEEEKTKSSQKRRKRRGSSRQLYSKAGGKDGELQI